VKDEVVHLRSSGVDFGERLLLACTRSPSPKRPGSWSLETERFGTTQAEIRRLPAWLPEARVEVVGRASVICGGRPVSRTLTCIAGGPREARRERRMNGNGALWVALVAGIGVVLVALRSTVEQIRSLRGTRVQARLVSCFRERAGRGQAHWKGAVQFSDPDEGLGHHVSVYLSGPRTPGQVLQVCYPPGRPARARVAKGTIGWQGPLGGLLVGSLFVAGALLILTGAVHTSPVPPH